MKLSIIITCYNEARTIRENLSKVEAASLPEGTEKEIIIVDDCSTDGSKDMLKPIEERHRVIYHEKNTGKGGAIRTGLAVASGDYIVIQDADLELDPNDLQSLMKPLLEGKADLVLGSRFLDRPMNFYNKSYLKYFLANRGITTAFNFLYFIWLTDVNCGYKMFISKIGKNLTFEANSFDIEVEILAKVIKGGYHIKEVPVSYNPRNLEEGKKIRLKHAFMMLSRMLKCRFN
ncbi:glycosyltransferase family 2 protein [Candidatus Falkowbacteria bacterium]|nr:glycosyltransferase family 2 protein [Candidatus Falkowbacteria bacterium]